MMFTGHSLLLLRSGGLPELRRMGLRSTTGPQNPSYVLVYDAETGELLSFMAYPFSDLRLHASVALGIDYLAKPTAKSVAMLGSGRNALGLLEAACTVRPFAEVRVHSPHKEHRERLADLAGQRLGIKVTAMDAPRDAVDDADIVIAATNSEVPVLNGAWLRPDAHVASIGSRLELDDDVFLRAELIAANSMVHEMNVHDIRDSWPLVHLRREGLLDQERVVEIGEVVAGKVTRPTGISVYRDARGGFDDVALASWAYERAVELGRGSDWSPI